MFKTRNYPYEKEHPRNIPKAKSASTINFDIYIAGDRTVAENICQKYCWDLKQNNGNGFCVNVQECNYVYTGGKEAGVKVGIINYPLFPETECELWIKVIDLGDLLMKELSQTSYTIVGPNLTTYFEREK